MLKAIHASEDREAADQKAAVVCEKLRAMKLPRAAEKIEQSITETLTYYQYPRAHWRRIRTNNALECAIHFIWTLNPILTGHPRDGISFCPWGLKKCPV